MTNSLCRLVDKINETVGRTVAWLFVPFTILVVVDVFTRYVLSKPWFYIDINIQFMGTLAVLGAGYCLLHDGHVSVDILVTRLSPRKRGILNVVMFPLFLTGVGALLWKVGDSAFDSILLLERYQSAFNPPLYPYRTIIAIGVFLLLLQGIAKFIRDLNIVIHLKPKEKP